MFQSQSITKHTSCSSKVKTHHKKTQLKHYSDPKLQSLDTNIQLLELRKHYFQEQSVRGEERDCRRIG
jgi:hypothetical protein